MIKKEFRPWTFDEYNEIVEALKKSGCLYIKGREEYVLLKKIVNYGAITEDRHFSKGMELENSVKQVSESSGVILDTGKGVSLNDTTISIPSSSGLLKPFLAPLAALSLNSSISDVIPSFRSLQSDLMCLNIGLSTVCTDAVASSCRHVLSLQMSVIIGFHNIRYFFLVDPRFQTVSSSGGQIPLKYCLADILCDLKRHHLHALPLVFKNNLVFRDFSSSDITRSKVVDYNVMKDFVIPVSLICHNGKFDISVFRRSNYDVDLLRKCAEIQDGCISVEKMRFKAANDQYFNYFWLIDLTVRDTLGLTPDEYKSLADLGTVTGIKTIDPPDIAIADKSAYAVHFPVDFYEYAMNSSDIVVAFCSSLFRANHVIPMTLSSAASSSMFDSIKRYFGVTTKREYDRIYRGLEKLEEGIFPDKNERMRFLRSTRYVPIRDNPDARLVSEYFEEAYAGGFNASFYLGWITDKTTDFDLQNAYPTAMATIIDVDWSQPVCDFPKNYEISLADFNDPLIPAAAVCDFDFPDECYCPNIPVPVKGGMKIYPRHGRNVYVTGPDLFLALKLGARVKIFRGFTCSPLKRNDGDFSHCLAYAVSNLVQDRMRAKDSFKDNPVIEKILKTMVNSCYGKTAQNVSPKTRYNAKKMGRVDAEPSSVTSPYHAAYTTALVRCMLIACINQLHDKGFHIYSVTTDGFITDAPQEVLNSIDAYGFFQIFQHGRYVLNQTSEECPANHVWEAKHYNDTFLNITTRGNVAVNDCGVLAHNSYTTGQIKDSRADRDAYIIAVLAREGKLECPTVVWTEFSKNVERKHDFQVSETIRHLSMDFDYKRCPIVETAVDTPVYYESVDGQSSVDTIIAEFDTRPFNDESEYMSYRITKKNEKCIKVRKDLERVKIKSTVKSAGYIGKDLDRKILISILKGYRSGLYKIPVLDGLKQAKVVEIVNSWGIATISKDDWKNCSRAERQDKRLPYEVIEDTLQKIWEISGCTG